MGGKMVVCNILGRYAARSLGQNDIDLDMPLQPLSDIASSHCALQVENIPGDECRGIIVFARCKLRPVGS